MDQRIIAHLDLDMFYAAIVLRDDPSLIRKPLIIGNPNARVSHRGVVLTCSYEARAFGVHSGMSMAEALKLCPKAEIRRSIYEENSKTSRSIMKYLKSLGVPIRVASIDEAYLDITEIVDNMYEAFEWAKKVKSSILETERITASVGIGHTKIIAKIASDYHKPNGITVVTENGIEEFFHNMKFSKIPGIGKKSAKHLANRGYTRIGQVSNMSLSEMRLSLGSVADFIMRVINAETSTDLTTQHERKSISHERTFHSADNDIYFYLKKLELVFNKTYDELVNKKLCAKTVTVKLRYNGFETITRSRSLNEFSDDREILHHTMIDLAKPYLNDNRGFRLVGVKFSNFKRISLLRTKISDYF